MVSAVFTFVSIIYIQPKLCEIDHLISPLARMFYNSTPSD